MNSKRFLYGVAILVWAALFFSCAVASSRRTLPPEQPGPILPERPIEWPDPSEDIMGAGLISEEQLALFLERNNPLADQDFALELAGYYIEEAAAEGVNHDTAFAQMCLETGFLRYGGLVGPEMNNFCGLGAVSPERPGEVFPDPQTGVRAHIQHLKAYAIEEPLNGELVDPRYRWVRYGSSPTIKGLSGTWAKDTGYSGKIIGILRRLYEFSFNPGAADEPAPVIALPAAAP